MTSAIHSRDGDHPPDLFSNGVPSAKSQIIASACLLNRCMMPLDVGVGSQVQSEQLRSSRRLKPSDSVLATADANDGSELRAASSATRLMAAPKVASVSACLGV